MNSLRKSANNTSFIIEIKEKGKARVKVKAVFPNWLDKTSINPLSFRRQINGVKQNKCEVVVCTAGQ